MQTQLESVKAFIWHDDFSGEAWWRRELRRFARIMMMVARELKRGMLALRAMSLVYTTLLSFVPLLAVSFSMLKGFGVHNQLEPMLLNLLEPLGEQSAEISSNVVGFVENMKIGVLGALGLGMLIFTVISLIQKIESAFNHTWRLRATRNLSQRFSNYLSVVMVGPLLIFSAVGITASLQSHRVVSSIEALPYMSDVIQFLGYLLPYLMIIAAFLVVYLLVPNTRVKPLSALYGAVIAGLLWRWTGMLFAEFAGGSTSYTAIYSGFAILLLFMIWLYLGWLILLIGASIAYYHQHPEAQGWSRNEHNLSGVMRENLCLQLMQTIAHEHFHSAGQETSVAALSRRLQAPQSMTERMLNTLESCGLLVTTGGTRKRYLPARAIEQIELVDIWRCARRAEDAGLLEQLQRDESVITIEQQVERVQADAFAGKTLRDLI